MSLLSDWEFIDMVLAKDTSDYLEHRAWYKYYKEIEREEKQKEFSNALEKKIKSSNLPNKNKAISLAHSIRYANDDEEVEKIVDEIRKITEEAEEKKERARKKERTKRKNDLETDDLYEIAAYTILSLKSIIIPFIVIGCILTIFIMMIGNSDSKKQLESQVIVESGTEVNEEIEETIKQEEKINPEGLTKISIQSIKDDLNSGKFDAKSKYIGNSYIFEVKIDNIVSDTRFETSIDEDDYAGSQINLNSADAPKLRKYKEGDTITICGRIDKIGLYHKIIINNASIME